MSLRSGIPRLNTNNRYLGWVRGCPYIGLEVRLSEPCRVDPLTSCFHVHLLAHKQSKIILADNALIAKGSGKDQRGQGQGNYQSDDPVCNHKLCISRCSGSSNCLSHSLSPKEPLRAFSTVDQTNFLPHIWRSTTPGFSICCQGF